MSIRARIAFFGGATIAITLIVFGGALYWLASSGVTSDQKALLRKRAEESIAAIATAPFDDFEPRAVLSPIDLRAVANSDNGETYTAVYDRMGTVITSTGLIDGQAPTIDVAVIATAVTNGSFLTTIESHGLPLRVYVAPWSRSDLGREGVVVAGQSANQVKRQLVGLKVLIILTSVIVLFGALIPIWRVAGRALRPLRTIAETVDEIGQTQDLSRRLPPIRTGDDLARLSVSFNSMLERLEEAQTHLAAALDTQRQFIADASHELRTPLTTIRSNAGFLLARPDVLPDDRQAALEDIATESDRMSRLVNDLLLLARADAGYRPPMAQIDLATLLRDCWRQGQRLHTSRDLVLLEPVPQQPVMIAGNRDLLTQLCWILIDNAVKHTPRGGRIECGLTVDREQRHAAVTISDDGSGIAEIDLPHVFERFYQADRARSSEGAGLGLAIAQWIVRDHKGQITAANNPGGGARLTIILPLSAPS